MLRFSDIRFMLQLKLFQHVSRGASCRFAFVRWSLFLTPTPHDPPPRIPKPAPDPFVFAKIICCQHNWWMCWNFKAWHSQRNVQLNCKHSDGAIKPRVHTNTVREDHSHGLHSNKPSPFIANGSPYEFPCDWAGGGEILWTCVKNVIFLEDWTQWNLTPHSNFVFQTPPSDQLWTEREDRGRERELQSRHVSCLLHSQRNVGKPSQCCQSVRLIRACSS